MFGDNYRDMEHLDRLRKLRASIRAKTEGLAADIEDMYYGAPSTATVRYKQELLRRSLTELQRIDKQILERVDMEEIEAEMEE